ncbi:hypothetical protein PIB30_043299 [Stylosanthes scabra]|uniref:C2 domain-containing protein n=1 Tax=Stylosanthes scabra TaxID=79078 RepID=A0ABU6ZEA0_9FABA|nr:hypothetical protein [Stylosanthes scabra]
MGITWVEVFLVSAHGLQHSTSLWKRQWFAVVWIDYNSKYCTKVDDSENASPVWRTKFSIPVDNSVPNFQDSALNVEVYSIEPIFLMEKLHGSATVDLREFLDKGVKNSEDSQSQLRQAEIWSYQLRKKNTSKPRGFIDISICVHEVKKEPKSQSGVKTGMMSLNGGNDTHLTRERLGQAHPQIHLQYSYHQEENHEDQRTVPNSHSVPFPAINNADPYEGEPSYVAAAGPSYEPLRTQTPPPLHLSNVGYIPTFFTKNDCLPPSYTDMTPPGKHPGRPRALEMGLGAGALAAGALIFGDDFMSGFEEVSQSIGDDYLIKEINPPF